MTDTNITLTPSGLTGSVTITASAALFTSDDVGRMIALYNPVSGPRAASSVYSAGSIIWTDDRGGYGVVRLYRVIYGGATAAVNMAGTTPNYDLNAPHEESQSVADGTCVLRYLGRGKSVWGWGTITGYTSSTQVTMDVSPNGCFGTTAATFKWRLGEWGGARGWPSTVSFFQNRTMWGGSTASPQTLWASQSGDFWNMAPSEPDDTVIDTNSITATMDDDQVNTIRWLLAQQRGLAVGTDSGEFMVGPASQTNLALSPSNILARRQGSEGSSQITPAIRPGNALIFVQRGDRRVKEFAYDFGSDSYQSPDLTIRSQHITDGGLQDMTFQQLPAGLLWLARDDGALACLTYDRDQQTRAWTRHQLGGAGIVESLTAVPNPDGVSDDVYLAVKRTLNGATVRSIEVIRAPYEALIDGDAGGFFVDMGLTYSGTAANVFTGLGHLEGQTVSICADGAQRSQQVVTGGSVSIGLPLATTVHIGLPYTSTLTTLPIEAGAGGGTAQGRPKLIAEVTLRLLESRACQVGGATAAELEDVPFRTVSDPMTAAVPLFTGDKRVSIRGGWDRNGQVTVQSAAPEPLTVLAIIQEVQASA